MNLVCIPTLTNNYTWILKNDNKQCLIIDPGEAPPVLKILSHQKLKPIAFLLTHHHWDHINGVNELLQYFSSVPVYGPEETRHKGATQIVNENDCLILLGHTFIVIALPGHTLGHIGFYCNPWFFCGDTIFSAGCGRIYEGTSSQMYESLQKINRLPSTTIICPAHENTLENLNFAVSILPKDKNIVAYQSKVKSLQIKNQPSLPTNLSLERKVNLFLRCNDLSVQKGLDVQPSFREEKLIFSMLRNKKDYF
ncbi:hydroxyacylglutathione hydrolase [Sodalis sp. CWE]|uniref:hydroxyacylglutathione hydrolase n=1 Tax=Sodalis sp. CWE TaxID=2803816 RepID=UPI001C7CDB7B|nr:hydroxyacylglutathione hydrolase [Sodalis sp. CWE]MBX4181219.1 hydroxyacylglutathione hydrolase [Sodalis sp. CWE]